ncbi:MAG: hypothetical protein ACK4K0_02265 [Flavobacteriales bacterium]
MKYIITTFFFLIFVNSTSACDVCGCSAGGSYLGILPQFQKNLFGMRYNYQTFSHPNSETSFNGASKALSDEFHNTDTWVRYYPSNRIQLLAFVPYKVRQRVETEKTTTIHGLGDISFLLNYVLINTGDSTHKAWKNTLLVGGGVKLPNAKYRQRDAKKQLLPAAFQLGTGAYAYTLGATYTTRYRNWGLNTDAYYRIQTENESTYQFGNQFSASAALFYWKNKGKTTILPHAGVQYESFDKDYEWAFVKPYTGGSLLMSSMGIDLYHKRAVFSSSFQIPMAQQIPSNQPAPQWRASVGLAVLF